MLLNSNIFQCVGTSRISTSPSSFKVIGLISRSWSSVGLCVCSPRTQLNLPLSPDFNSTFNKRQPLKSEPQSRPVQPVVVMRRPPAVDNIIEIDL